MRVPLAVVVGMLDAQPSEEALAVAHAYDARALLSESEEQIARHSGLHALEAAHAKLAAEHRRSALEALGAAR